MSDTASEPIDKQADAIMQMRMMREELHSLRTLLSRVEASGERAAEERDEALSQLAEAQESMRLAAHVAMGERLERAHKEIERLREALERIRRGNPCVRRLECPDCIATEALSPKSADEKGD